MGTGAAKVLSTDVHDDSTFFCHCRDGNSSEVRTMLLSQLIYEQINEIYSNGNTALHIAVINNHFDVVKLLLDNGCSRIILNPEGKTAYQLAQNDEIRQLFNRPSLNRFVDENLDSFRINSTVRNNIPIEEGIPDNWFKGHSNSNDAHDAQFMLSIAESSDFLKKILRNRTENESKKSLGELLDKHNRERHPMFRKARDLYEKFREKSNINHLFTLYKLETPIYKALQNDANSFTTLVYLHLSELQVRAYQGHAYRGGRMTKEDIQAYQWALNDQQRILETRTIQSMSKKQSIAEGFSKRIQHDNRHSVLLIFEFPHRCPTAIDLTQISTELPLLSEYEKEEEVTLLPFSLFNVHKIHFDSNNNQYQITLTNVSVPQKTVLMAWKNLN